MNHKKYPFSFDRLPKLLWHLPMVWMKIGDVEVQTKPCSSLRPLCDLKLGLTKILISFMIQMEDM
jgi:hypothetical protein